MATDITGPVTAEETTEPMVERQPCSLDQPAKDHLALPDVSAAISQAGLTPFVNAVTSGSRLPQIPPSAATYVFQDDDLMDLGSILNCTILVQAALDAGMEPSVDNGVAAVFSQAWEPLNLMVDNDLDVMTRDQWGQAVLPEIAGWNQPAVLERALSLADLTSDPDVASEAMTFAVSAASDEEIRLLAKAGAPITERTLQEAVQAELPDSIFDLLMELTDDGARIDVSDPFDYCYVLANGGFDDPAYNPDRAARLQELMEGRVSCDD